MVRQGFSILIFLIFIFAGSVLNEIKAAPARISVEDFHQEGSPTAGIQEAVDALGPEGGVVFIPSGVYEISRSIILRSGVQLKGEGEHTVIARRDPCIQVPLKAASKKGETKVKVASSQGFRVGGEATVRSDESHGWWCTHAIITAIEGDLISLDRELTHDYLPEEDGILTNFFPAFYANEQERIRIEDLVIDGRMESSQGLTNDFTLSAIHFRDVRDAVISRVKIKRYPGDGFSMQIGDNITVSDCLAEYNLGHGYHPGTGITSGSWTNNVGRFNGWDGLFFCHRVRHTTVSGNRFHDNGWNGIGGLGVGGDGGDRYNVVSGNFCYNNARSGIQCTRGGNNVIVNNVCENNSQGEAGRWPGILVEDTHSSIISGNRCLDFQHPDSTKTQFYGILVTGSSRNNIITGNILSGHTKAGISGDALDRNTMADNITLEKHKPEGI